MLSAVARRNFPTTCAHSAQRGKIVRVDVPGYVASCRKIAFFATRYALRFKLRLLVARVGESAAFCDIQNSANFLREEVVIRAVNNRNFKRKIQ